MGRFCVRDDETSTFIAGHCFIPWQSDRPSEVRRAYDVENVYTSARKSWTRAVQPSCSRIRVAIQAEAEGPVVAAVVVCI